jgi:hypothetical protein
MRTLPTLAMLLITPMMTLAGGLPVFTVQPTNQLVSPGGNGTLVAMAAGAEVFQWRFNGADISGATNSTLTLSNLQTTNSGYYMAVAKNSTGWAPSQLAWLSVVPGAGGVVPLSNSTNNYFAGQAAALYPTISEGRAQVVAGPALDQMQPVGPFATVTGGYYDYEEEVGISPLPVYVPTVAPGQTVYYSVSFMYTNQGTTYARPSTVMSLVAGGNGLPTPSVYGLKFPGWPEWPEPMLLSYLPTAKTNQLRVLGESFSFTNSYFAYTDYGIPRAEWRKDGNPIAGATNFVQTSGGSYGGFYQGVLNLTNAQPEDAGVYDLVDYGNNWTVSPKIVLSIQVDGRSALSSPRIINSNFVCDFDGVQGRNYAIEWSINLTSWKSLTTVSNGLGSFIFTNALSSGGNCFYRTRLLP